MAYILSLVVLALCTSLAVTMAASNTLNLARAENMETSFSAQVAAESGLAFMLQSVAAAKLPEDTDYDTLMSNLAGALGEVMNDTENLGQSVVSSSESTVTIPTITFDNAAFDCVVSRLGPDSEGYQQVRVSVVGTSGSMSRKVSLDMQLKAVPPGAFAYGIATKGTISMSGNAKLRSMGSADDANVFSAAFATTVISANGNPELDGDLYLCTDNIAAVALTGNVEIGGETDIDEILISHTHLGQDEPEFPELDLSPFPALAVNVLSKKVSNNKTLNNVYVPANLNPMFNGNTTINGIVYIEAPNKVKFNGNLVLNGFVITEDGSDLPISGNEITFNGNLSVPGISALPDTAEFAAVKAYEGTAILAPGFGLKFSGNNSGINGMIAADQLTFTGNSTVGGELTGTILGLKDLPMTLSGNTEITINRQDDDSIPAGFKCSAKLNIVPNSYAEYAGQ
jgi:hypothetical protein